MILKQPESWFCGSCSPKPSPAGALVACPEAPSRGLLLATRLGRGDWDLPGSMAWKAHAQSALVQTGPHVVRRPGCAAPHLGLTSFSSKACWRSCLAPSHLPASISSRCRKAAPVWVFMYDLHRASVLEQRQDYSWGLRQDCSWGLSQALGWCLRGSRPSGLGPCLCACGSSHPLPTLLNHILCLLPEPALPSLAWGWASQEPA